ncbi:monosaccharide ABC transporter ATP-binding protein (CUT2 family) [Jatrophihabitans sp. GAS493]|uniref:ATP-binding cassette domain-containing protein n=1 Tax=Jatrophihabitans sp. GAS493 TaxID=1907575 RepID=UPI000BB91FEB|nr:ATP-binding cassette domain-containing protein [Jatrophihabitans sp. GAS493]SOD73710.1 monosaccharide ABC transporter ATP-binding protein (CUT2 family) [Jatrophihabitans sp. GAS493]
MTAIDIHEVPPATPGDADVPMLEIRNITKMFGSVISLSDISTTVRAGQVTCVLGDNGAGKSTFIKSLAGVHRPDSGEFLIDGKPVTFNSPRDSLDAGIATVYQDLAMVPLMAIWRNFFLGSEPTKGWGIFRRFDAETCKKVTRKEMSDMGIDIRDPDQPVGTLSGGERQCVAIARAVHFGARLLILDEPTSALGVKQSGVVLKYIAQARDKGLGVIFITHNPHHAYPVGDRFLLLKRGKSLGDYAKADISLGELTRLMAGGAELEALAHELEREGDGDANSIGSEMLKESKTFG